jgi:hypothetical protein
MSFDNNNIVSFRSLANGKLVCAENAGANPLITNRDVVGPWEQFEMVQNGDGFAFKSIANGMHVCAEAGGSQALIANRPHKDLWERFYI